MHIIFLFFRVSAKPGMKTVRVIHLSFVRVDENLISIVNLWKSHGMSGLQYTKAEYLPS